MYPDLESNQWPLGAWVNSQPTEPHRAGQWLSLNLPWGQFKNLVPWQQAPLPSGLTALGTLSHHPERKSCLWVTGGWKQLVIWLLAILGLLILTPVLSVHRGWGRRNLPACCLHGSWEQSSQTVFLQFLSCYNPKLAPKGESRIWKGVAISASGLSEVVLLCFCSGWDTGRWLDKLRYCVRTVYILNVYL